MNRLYNLDYLRGLAAFGIMIYHYLLWITGKFTADTFMGRFGIYGVSIFYILSGLTLFYVYFDKMKPLKEDIISFLKKRIFRIFPLLWLVTIFAIVLSRKKPDYYDLFLNLSGLFGFIKWDVYFSAGIWSIGNELVFYAFFPFFVLFTKYLKPLMILLSTIVFGLYLYFAFYKLNQNLTINEQWTNYINPLNQVFLFLAGFLTGLFLQNINIKQPVVLFMLIFGIGLFIFYPAAGDLIHLVTGVNRLIFTASCLLICIAFYKMTFALPQFIHKPLTLLGEASYSVYLIHPLVYYITVFVLKILSQYVYPFPKFSSMIIAAIATVIISYFVYQYFEKYFIKLGKLAETRLSHRY
jgi:exopolysaccharide production protein ExoZ